MCIRDSDNTDPARHGDLYEQLLNKFYVADRNDLGCKDPVSYTHLHYIFQCLSFQGHGVSLYWRNHRKNELYL